MKLPMKQFSAVCCCCCFPRLGPSTLLSTMLLTPRACVLLTVWETVNKSCCRRLYEYYRPLVLNAVWQVARFTSSCSASGSRVLLVYLTVLSTVPIVAQPEAGIRSQVPSVVRVVYKLALGQVLTCSPISIIPFRPYQSVIHRTDNGPTGGQFHSRGVTPPQDNSTECD